MKVATFQGIADRYAAVVGQNDKVTLTFGGQMAYTDGRHVNLPALPSGTVMTPHEAVVFNGYLDHETAHVRWTNFQKLKEAEPELTDKVLHHIWNIIEDIRIEKEQINLFPGSRLYLDTLAMEVDTQGQKRDSEVPQTKSRRILSLLYKELWENYRKVAHIIPVQGTLSAEGDLGRDINNILVTDMGRMGSERDTLRCAKKIRKLLDDEIQKDQQQAQQQGQKIMDKALQMLGIGGKPGEDKPDDQPGEAMTKEELEAAAALESSIRERVEAFSKLMQDIQKANAVEKEPGQSSYKRETWEGKQILPPATTSNDRIFVPSAKDRRAYEQAKNQLSTEITTVKKMCRIYLQSRSRAAWSRGLEEGQLDQDALTGLFVGDRNVYKDFRHRRIVDTAVLILLDLSGSMDSLILRHSAILLSEALQPIQNLALCIAGFTTNSGRARNRQGQSIGNGYGSGGAKGIGRLEGLDIHQFKGWNEPYAQAQDRLGAIKATSSTPLGDGYGHGFAHIVNRPEKRKILWIVSDGEPAITVGDSQHNELLLMERMHKMCSRHGVEVWGLGIGSHLRLKDFVDRYAEIQECTQLPATVLNSVREVAR